MIQIPEEYVNKFIEELDESFSCQICMCVFGEKIFLCSNGHELCENCKTMVLNVCPSCKAPITNSRSYLAETLLKKAIESKKILSNIISSQKEYKDTSTQYSEFHFLTKGLHLPAPKGTYPCKIGACTKEEPHCRIMEHIRIHHKNKLKTGTSEINKTYTTSWNIDFSPATDFDFALHILNMELFFVHISFDNEGSFIGNIQIANTNDVASIFTYKLTLKRNNSSCTYEDSVPSCTSPPELLDEKSLHVHHTSIKKMLKDEKTLECVLVINYDDQKLIAKTKKNQLQSQFHTRQGRMEKKH